MSDANPAADGPAPERDALVREAHRVLVHRLPGAALPHDLGKIRALLDTHMFGREERDHRDAVVRIARQIDRILSPRSR